jgi:kojibiose phosphorylase
MKDLFLRYLSNEDWLIRENGWDKNQQTVREAQFSLGNGYICSRGVLEEIPYDATPGTFLAGVYDKTGAQITELVNLPNPVDFKIIVQGEKLDVVAMDVLKHERVLDMGRGILARNTIFQNAHKQRFKYQSIRFFSMEDVHIGAMRIAFTPLDVSVNITVQNIIDTSITNRGFLTEGRKKHYQLMKVSRTKDVNYLLIRTFESKISIGYADYLQVYEGKKEFTTKEKTFHLRADKGQTIYFTEIFSIYSTRDVLLKDLKQQTIKALNRSVKINFDGLLKEHIQAWQNKWRISDIIVKPNREIQKAVRFNIYHLLIAGNDKAQDTSIGAKALTGEGYRGHIFWDAEIFILPFFMYTNPVVARNMLMYRYNRLDVSRKEARSNGYRGAQFAWESADTGEEVTPSWHKLSDGSIIKISTGHSEDHIVCDVAYGVDHYCNVTGDVEFMENYGLEIIFETARFWASRVQLNKRRNRYEIRHVIGPDEFREDVNNNAFTNMMARWNLLRAVELHKAFRKKHPHILKKLSKKIKLKESECKQWRQIGRRMFIPKSKKKNLIEECEGYFKKKDIKITSYDKNGIPILSKTISERKMAETQFVKQADVVMLLYLLSNTFTEQQKKRNYFYYIKRTLHKSSLSPSINAIIAAEVGDLERAFRLFLTALFTDLKNIYNNTDDGIHAASLGGVWQVLVKGFGGMRIKRNILTFNPSLPKQISLIRFSIKWRDCDFDVAVYRKKIKLFFKSPTRKKIRFMIYKKIEELSANEVATFFKKGR